MQKLDSSEWALLQFIDQRGSLPKRGMQWDDLKCAKQLVNYRLLSLRDVETQGPTYFVTEAGKVAIKGIRAHFAQPV